MLFNRRTAICGLIVAGCGAAAKPGAPAGYQLTFADEFTDTDVSRINENAIGGRPGAPAWRSRYRHDRLTTINKEKQVYMDPAFSGTGVKPLGVQPFEIIDGVLRIRAEKADSDRVAPMINGMQYTSGCITTEYTFSQQYGYFEMRARLPSGRGFWPAFWLLPVKDKWPPEIDIFEGSGTRERAVHVGYILPGPGGTGALHGGDGGYVNSATNLVREFTVFGLEWTAESLAFFIDGRESFRRPNKDIHEPMYLLANLAIGSYDSNWIPDPDDSTSFPAFFEIDYIRAYRKI